MGTTYVCQRCHNKFTDCKLLDGADYGNYLRDQGMFSPPSWYCKSCYAAAKREFKASKKAEKAAKQAAHEEEYESGGGSSSSGELPSGCVKIVGMILAFLVVCGILGALFYKSEDANDPAVKMAKWEEHLEKRRAAFAEGLSEEGVEARGLKNFTWEEWQNRSKAKAAENPAEKVEDIGELWSAHQKKRREFINAGHTREEADAAGLVSYTLDEFKQNYKNIKYKTQEDIGEKYREHMNKRMSLLNGGLTDKVLHEMGYDDYTFEAFKQNYKNIKYKTLEEVRQIEAEAKARAEAEAQAKAESESERRADSLARKEAEAKARAEASARAKAEAENKRLAEKLARKEAEEKARAREQARAKMEAETKAKAEAESKRRAEMQAREKAEAKARAEAEAKAKAEADAKSNVLVGSEDSVSGQQDKHKPSKDSNGIRIVVQGKGKTKDAAVRWAIRDAVWKTIGTWVDSKARIQENHDKVVAQVKTITEADVAKFEVMDTQMQDGGFVVKVRVSVSKKKIAPKFAEIFPDVFGNE